MRKENGRSKKILSVYGEKVQKGITILQVKSNVRFLDFTGEITFSDNELEFRLLK
jgi:hypothetical protein